MEVFISNCDFEHFPKCGAHYKISKCLKQPQYDKIRTKSVCFYTDVNECLFFLDVIMCYQAWL